MIIHYVRYCHPNWKKLHRYIRSCVVVNVVYLPKLYIHHYYHGVIGINKSSKIKAKILEIEGLGKKKNGTLWVGAAKSKRKAIKSGTTPWELKQKWKVNLKINDQIKKSLYSWIMYHPQVVKSPIFNDCLKVNIDGHTVPKMVPFFETAGIRPITS